MVDSKKLTLDGFSGVSSSIYYKDKRFLDTGCILLNWAIAGTAKRGYPFGRIIELYGDPSTGKSLLAYMAMASVQKIGGVAVLDDVEYALEPDRASNLGLVVAEDSGQFFLRSSKTIEEAYNNIASACQQLKDFGVKDAVIVLDSLGQVSTKHEVEEGLETADMTKAKQIRKTVRLVAPLIAESGYLLIILNHTIDNIGNMFVKKTVPGGGGVKFGASVRVELTYAGKYFKGDDNFASGATSKFFISKNRMFKPFREGKISIDFTDGVERYSGILDTLIDCKIGISPKGSQYIEIAGKKFKKLTFNSEFESISKELGFETPEDCLDTLLTSGGA